MEMNMKKSYLSVVLCAMLAIPGYAQAKCDYDNQCKGNGVCENDQCVSPGSKDKVEKDLPQFCCTAAGKLDPIPNPGSNGVTVHVGDSCSGTASQGQQVFGKSCM
jgi:hypothetical protein